MGTRLMHETYPLLSWRDFSHHRSHDISSEAHLQPADIHGILMKLEACNDSSSGSKKHVD